MTPDLATGSETGPGLSFPPHPLPNLLFQSPFFKHLNGKSLLAREGLEFGLDQKWVFGSIKRDIQYPLGAFTEAT